MDERMEFIFKDPKTETELALPITPSGFEISKGKRIETVSIHTVGDVALGGYGTLDSPKIECIFPAREYPFANTSEIEPMEPYEYIEIFEAWAMDPNAILRFIITQTPVNIPVLIENIKYSEKDGTGDVYATISMKEHRELSVIQMQKEEKTENETREETIPPKPTETYVVVSGDTMWAIARKYYGDGMLAYALADYNGIQNANLIFPQQVINLPEKDLLV